MAALTCTAAMAVGWWLDHHRFVAEQRRMFEFFIGFGR
jgi:hypothetical protein